MIKKIANKYPKLTFKIHNCNMQMRFSSGMESFKYIQTFVTSQSKSQTKTNLFDKNKQTTHLNINVRLQKTLITENLQVELKTLSNKQLSKNLNWTLPEKHSAVQTGKKFWQRVIASFQLSFEKFKLYYFKHGFKTLGNLDDAIWQTLVVSST